jgi:hypothetical protein
MSVLAAGAIGSLITISAALLVRLIGVPREIGSHDRRARERDSDLAQWTADRDLALRRELEATRRALAARGALSSGDYPWELGLVKERALHEWRDQALTAKRDVAAIYDREGWLQDQFRRMRKQPAISLDRTLTAASTVLNCWQAPPAHDQGGATTIAPGLGNDPTERTLAGAVRDAPGRLREYQ